MPIVGRNSFVRTASPSPWHTHRGCIEIVYCQHGMCEYESCGQIYRLTPGRVFVSRPTESHRMLSNPKGLATCYLLFRLPGRGNVGPFAPEVAFWAKRLKQLPRLFDAGSRTGSWFVRLFRILDTRFADLAERRIRLHHVCTGLLLSVIDASTTQFATGKSDRIAALAECPAQAHLKRRGILGGTRICWATRVLNDALCEGSPFEIVLEETGEGSCRQVLRRKG